MANKLLLCSLLLVAVALPLATADSDDAVISSGPKVKFTVTGKVYCDTCRCGFETNITKYIPEANVRIVCVKRTKPGVVTYTEDGKTDKTGSFTITVTRDMGDDICQVELVSSPWSYCNQPDPGRKKATVILTNANGMQSSLRKCNHLGFLIDQPLPECKALMQYYLADADEKKDMLFLH